MSYSYSGNENANGSQGNSGGVTRSRLEAHGDAYIVQGGDQAYSNTFTNVPQVSAFTAARADYGVSATGQTHSQVNTNQILADVLRAQSSHEPAHVNSSAYLSSVEAAILRSSVPIDLLDSTAEEISVSGHRGIWLNKAEVANWRGLLPINQYSINEDANPEIITKRTQQNLTYIQELAIRYLRPPTPPPPGDIVITQEVNSFTPPAPPLVIRQQPARPATPEPLVIRESPPQPPPQVGRKVITISGKRLPPPPRKVIIERLAPLPSKPQGIMIERWLPYNQTKRRVIFQKAQDTDAIVVKPRNVIIQWEAPQVTVKKDLKYLGIIRANPVEYVQRYGSTLKKPNELPDFVLDIQPPQGIVLAADYKYNQVHELEGEVQALKLVDLEKEGLAQYREQVNRLGVASNSFNSSTINNFNNNYGSYQGVPANLGTSQIVQDPTVSYPSSNISDISNLLGEIFAKVDRDGSGSLTFEEAEKLLLKLNSRLGRRYGQEEVRAFFETLDINNDGTISLFEFKRAFERLS